MKKICYVLNSCNEWKEYSSSQIIGVYDNIDLLREKIQKLFLNNEIDFDNIGVKDIEDFIRNEYTDYFNNPEEFDVSIEEVENEIKNKIEEYKQKKSNDIANCNCRDLNIRCQYILIQEFELNTI